MTRTVRRGGRRGDGRPVVRDGRASKARMLGGWHSIDMERGLGLFRELFRRLSRVAMRRRTRGGAGRPIDIDAAVAEIQDRDLEAARRANVTIRAARAAALAAVAG
eukprot:5367885-Pleurochrysis_carterae.AAC.1